MITITCTLTFTDGAKATGKLSADNPYDSVPVTYSGAVDRLKVRFERTDAPALRASFKNMARSTGADVSVLMIGNYDVAE